MFETKLEKSLKKWENTGGDLKEIIYNLEENEGNIVTESQAESVVSALQKIELLDSFAEENIYAIAALFQQVETKEGYEILYKKGILKLVDLYDRAIVTEKVSKDTLMFVLKIFAMYGIEQGADRIISASKNKIKPDSYLWSVIFGQLGAEHPYSEKVLESLKEDIPDGFAAIAYLDFVNGIAINKGIDKHPFDTEEGYKKLKNWICSEDEEEYSYAHSSTAALPFIGEPARSELLNMALNHNSIDVKMEAAWAMVKSGNNKGLDFLIEKSQDVRYSTRAIHYIKELGYENKLFEIDADDDFFAMAEMCDWLSHPNEFGCPPDEIEKYDSRKIFWPPTNDEREVWLFKYNVQIYR